MALRALRRAAGQLGSSLVQAQRAAGVVTAVELGPCCAEVLARQSSSQTSSNNVREELSSFNAAARFRGISTQLRGLRTSAFGLEAFEVKVPPMGESITEGTIATLLKKPGDAVKEDDIIAQIETDKVTIDVKYTGKAPGVVSQVLINPSDLVKVGQQVAVVETGAAPAAAPAAAAAPPPPPKPAAEAPKPPPAPAAPKQGPVQPAFSSVAAPMPTSRPERRVKMTRLRMRVAERLKGAQNTYAMLSTFNEIDMSGTIELRNTYKDAFVEKHNVKLGFMSVFVKAAAYALQEVPAVNAVIEGDEIVFRDYYDISIAVATPKGLVVPVLRAADELSFADVEKTINLLGKKARDGTIGIDDMAGGTFTISNGGVYGSLLSTPIINPPQSAILGMHAIIDRPVAVKGKVEIRPIMNVALTYDHRLIDGREAVTFLRRIKDVVEDPRRLLLDI
ncbi:2-oxoglutarate dehydrogenase, E2 component [Volvox carteri f. nagariensis]|uniref:dihydrolipoyllysine-residue succinyltransferase n=1 Tax=Volvox carteri f. nagariensis TaxID=3068 RepID=D8TZJ4_VOLCA|nr:2-oxoglutarate dehydrogenase, E2 component [Volvox carteri f. nagariensis]EFJ47284.1 2-oxoglutarate dehydrogenase, E2 component [Volvox carteri f. nagariensis]|eukprot:XP_002951833.1 2-oxoglutarate dehydrogenase, E2 component [Volvox carteri f. nagariensis]